MASGLESLSVDLTKTDFFITHLHVDHAGLVSTLASSTSKIYFSEIDASMTNQVTSGDVWQQSNNLYKAHGFPEGELEKAMAMHPARRYGPQKR